MISATNKFTNDNSINISFDYHKSLPQSLWSLTTTRLSMAPFRLVGLRFHSLLLLVGHKFTALIITIGIFFKLTNTTQLNKILSDVWLDRLSIFNCIWNSSINLFCMKPLLGRWWCLCVINTATRHYTLIKTTFNTLLLTNIITIIMIQSLSTIEATILRSFRSETKDRFRSMGYLVSVWNVNKKQQKEPEKLSSYHSLYPDIKRTIAQICYRLNWMVTVRLFCSHHHLIQWHYPHKQ